MGGIEINVAWDEERNSYVLSIPKVGYLGLGDPTVAIGTDKDTAENLFDCAVDMGSLYDDGTFDWSADAEEILTDIKNLVDSSSFEKKSQFKKYATINGIEIRARWDFIQDSYVIYFPESDEEDILGAGISSRVISTGEDEESATTAFEFAVKEAETGSIQDVYTKVVSFCDQLEDKKISEGFVGSKGGFDNDYEYDYHTPNAGLPPEMEKHPELKKEAEKIIAEIKGLRVETLKKISERLGTNEGGWYEDGETGDKYYVKFYENPDQARVEFLVNALYGRLGIKAPKSELLEMAGRLAIASKEIGKSESSYLEEQRDSAEVRAGFVADAYLANWDVVGLVFDNIVKTAEGNFVRIDNGGSLTFRAQGGEKDFDPDSIPELKNMLDPQYPAGEVFEGMTEEEMKAQAEILVHRLSVRDIKRLVKESGLSEELSKKIEEGLLGRRHVLMERFGIKEKVRIAKVFEDFEKDKKTLESGLRPKESILSDAGHIENQEIDFIDTRDRGFVTASFKLTAENYAKIGARLEQMEVSGGVENGMIQYREINGFEEFLLSKAWVIRSEGLVVKISKGTRYSFRDESARSSLGLVNIEIPVAGDTLDLVDLESRVDDVLRSFFGIEEGIAVPSLDAERTYKEARYKWHHHIEGAGQVDSTAAIQEKLARKEVFPGYSTFVEEGKHKEYEEKFGRIALLHSIGDAGRLVSVIKSAGLMSGHERYQRGLLLSGMSSAEDFASGGADSVFARAVTGKTPVPSGNLDMMLGSYNIIFKPSILDRTDWYSYLGDEYGSTRPEVMKLRKSPEVLFESISATYEHPGNELMFRTGIPLSEIAAVVCPDDASNPDPNAAFDRVVGMWEGRKNNSGFFSSLSFGRKDFTKKEFVEAWNKGPTGLADFFKQRNAKDFMDGYSYSIYGLRGVLLKALEEAGVTEVNGVPVAEFVIWTRKLDEVLNAAYKDEPKDDQLEDNAQITNI